MVVVGEIFFSGISGSTTADAATIVGAVNGMGILVSPCLTMVVYGSLTGVSIAALFAAGFLPAAVMTLALMGQLYVQAAVTISQARPGRGGFCCPIWAGCLW